MPDRSYLAWPFFDDRHRALAAEVERFASEALANVSEDPSDVDATCRTLVGRLAAAGLLRHAVPAAYGGMHDRLDVRSLCLVRETLARFAALADFAFAMQGLGSGAITLFGTEDQRRAYLPTVAAGQKIAALALSEPEAGSDLAAVATTAEPDGTGFVLNGAKAWISNAGIADFYVALARTGEAPGARGLSMFVVDAATPGLEVGDPIPLIAPHPLATLTFRNCRVPRAQLLGEPGQGFKVAMATLDIFRSTVGAAALGFARRALHETLEHASSRKLFGAPLGDLQMTQAAIADSATEVDAAALLVYRAAWIKDQGAARVTSEAAMAKMFATEAAQRVIDRAVQLHGGLGVTKGVKVEELYREIRALRIYEGATEVQKIVIAREALKDRAAKAALAAE